MPDGQIVAHCFLSDGKTEILVFMRESILSAQNFSYLGFEATSLQEHSRIQIYNGLCAVVKIELELGNLVYND